jgi:hypothetical protein
MNRNIKVKAGKLTLYVVYIQKGTTYIIIIKVEEGLAGSIAAYTEG